MINPKRLLFNWSNKFINNKKLGTYKNFQTSWQLSDNDYNDFIDYLSTEEKNLSLEDINIDKEYLKTMIKSEIAGNKWGRDELWGIRITADSQIMGALNHFNEADAFLVQSN